MYESETFVYLDVQKTASSFIIHFLNRFNCERLVQLRRHAPLRGDSDAGKLHFISVRDPLDQYLSLFSFGCGEIGTRSMKFKEKGRGSGTLAGRLERKGHGHLYERSAQGFQRWLEFVLDPSNAELVARPYARAGGARLSSLAGLQTFRFLNLAIRDP